MRRGARLFLVSMLVALIGAASRLTAPAPALAEQPIFTPRLDAICGAGTLRGAGCDAVRAREIVDANAWPYAAVGRLNYAGGKQRSHCTAALVSDRLALTAAHCLYNTARKRWTPRESLRLVTGYQRNTHRAVSTIRRIVLNPAIDTSTARFSVAPGDDWALVVLDEPLGRDPGHFNLFPDDTPPTVPGVISLPGYTHLRPHVLSVAHDCGAPALHGPLMTAGCATMMGDSGAPLLWQGPQGLFLLGIATRASGLGPPNAVLIAPWFSMRDAIEREIADGN